MLRPSGVLETVLYAGDLQAARDFYRNVIGLEALRPIGELGEAFRISEGQVLLIFDPARAGDPARDFPGHGAIGPGHVAFRINAADYDAWLKHLAQQSIEIEREVDWQAHAGWRPGRSIYVRDPAGNSVELVTSDIWPAGEPKDVRR